MHPVDFIEAKRDRRRHASEEIRDFVLGFTRGDIPDYQASAWLMAVCLNGLDEDETFALTRAMAESGDTLDLSPLSGFKLDKHSTGGVGDKVSLAVVPLLAASGVTVAKMSGRGLGFTGGTLDKLESIPGFRTSLDSREILDIVSRTGACICAQTSNLVPADRKMYALRDVTGTVESLPLIAASIMSKKIAGGADAVLLDVKAGRGAFMKTAAMAKNLASLLVKIGEAHGMYTAATITAMDSPLGRAVGNWMEVQEVAALLQGDVCDERLREVVVRLTGEGLALAGKGGAHEVEKMLSTGAGWEKFQEIVEAQGGELDAFDNPPRASAVVTVYAPAGGYVADIDALAIGRAAMRLGAGRVRKDDSIDPLAGVSIAAPVGARVAQGDPVAHLHASSHDAAQAAIDSVRDAFTITAAPPEPGAVILDEIRSLAAR